MNPASLCSAENSLLVVVDMQIRLLSAMPETERGAIVKTTEILLQAAQAMDIPVIYTEQYPKGLGPTVPAIMERLPATAKVVEKSGFSCCAADGFLDALNSTGRNQVILVGQEAHVCVLQTAMDLLGQGFPVFVVEDGVCSRSMTHKHNALMRLREAGVVISNSESVLFEWLRDAAHPDFKTISNLVR
ncbi:hydrolase [Methylomagnum sp.]